MYNDLEINNLPNRLTIFRVLMIPIIVGAMFVMTLDIEGLGEWKVTLGWWAGWIFVGASLTDFVDGYIARKRNIVTVFGSFLDPIADKFLVVSCLVMLQALGRLSPLVVIILILREFYMTALRLLASNESISVPVSDLGKWKTTTQMVGIPLLIASQKPWGIPMALLGTICIYIATFLSLYSATLYSLGLVRKMKEKRAKAKEEKRQTSKA